MSSIAENLDRVREQIAARQRNRGGRLTTSSWLRSPRRIQPRKSARRSKPGKHSSVKAACRKRASRFLSWQSNIRWHFVGHLQKNKVRQALPLFEMIHSVDSLALAQDINRIAEDEGLYPRALLEVNVAGEGSKFGFAPNKLREQMEEVLELPRLSIEGLMCIPPVADEAEASRQYFVALRKFRDSLENEFNLKLPHLSMGMTNDFPIAIQEGATLVRVGTAIFGERQKKQRATVEH